LRRLVESLGHRAYMAENLPKTLASSPLLKTS
jgi:hypothetical protein